MKILLLEDDIILSELIGEHLEEIGYLVDVAFDGYEALDLIESNKYDILLLDVGVPKLNGFELLNYLKEINLNIPTIYITSLSSAKDVEKAFNIGCDDYLKKPFELKELEVRIEHIKRVYSLDKKEYKISNICNYNLDLKIVIKDNKEYSITQKESLILEYFLKNKNRVISLDELVYNIWQGEQAPTYATIRTYIKNLRKILPNGVINTLKGVGYKFEI